MPCLRKVASLGYLLGIIMAPRKKSNLVVGALKSTRHDPVDGIVEDIQELLVLEDINADPNGESSKSQDKSAQAQIVKFYNMHVQPVNSFDDAVFASIDKERFGMLCTFMIQNPDIGYQSTMNYLSCIRRQLETKHNVTIFKDNPEWYKVTRKRVTRAYVLASIKGTLNNNNLIT